MQLLVREALVRVHTRSSRAPVRTLKPFVSSESGARTQETEVVGAGELGQAEGVEGVGLPASDPKAWSGGLQPVGMYRKHHESRLQQTPHQNAVRTLDRDALHAQLA